MQTMIHTKEAYKEYDHEFKWGERGGDGGTSNEVQFYKSFRYDGVEYSLYDCVYLYVENEPEPYVGKLVKIWELQTCEKLIKVIWFFRPIELLNWLGDNALLENEIFLASGRGKGLSNVNPLEVLVGKCNVVCTSRDKRNPQPSDIEVKMADYVFHRTFDVGNYKLSDKFEEKIAGIDVRYFFNRKECQKLIADPKIEATWKTDLSSKLDSAEAVVNAVKDSNQALQTTPLVKGIDSKKTAASPCEQGFVLDGKTLPRPKTFDKNETKATYILPNQAADKARLKSVKNLSHLDASENRPYKKIKLLDKLDKSLELEDNVSSPLGYSGESNTNIMQKLRVSSKENVDNSFEPSVRMSADKANKAKNGAVKDVVGQDRGISKMMNPGGKVARLCDEAALKLAGEKGNKNDSLVTVVTRRPDADKGKWFKQLPWEEAMQKAHEQGTLVLLKNLDPSYTSTEVEDIIWHTFNKRCAAKMTQHNKFSSPHYGQAFVIFKIRDEAEMVINKLKWECLMLPNGRPLVGNKGTPKEAGNPSRLVGHLSLQKNKPQMQRMEMKNAVSTSHYPQPNTLEYDMAVEWCVQQERSDLCWKALHEEHEKEFQTIKSQLKNP